MQALHPFHQQAHRYQATPMPVHIVPFTSLQAYWPLVRAASMPKHTQPHIHYAQAHTQNPQTCTHTCTHSTSASLLATSEGCQAAAFGACTAQACGSCVRASYNLGTRAREAAHAHLLRPLLRLLALGDALEVFRLLLARSWDTPLGGSA